MHSDYKNTISHIDIDRATSSMDMIPYQGMEDSSIKEFTEDIEKNNDAIELQLIRSKSYKEALILSLQKIDGNYSFIWRSYLEAEQKTFGGSKVFYMNTDCTKLLILALPEEMKPKLNMVVSRINKVNEKISRYNTRIKKENQELFNMRIKSKEANKKADELAHMINENLKA